MEYLPLGDLKNYYDSLTSPLPESEIQQIAFQILEGLVYMHDDGYAHRDLKPSNILIKAHCPKWWVKIGDLGISKRTEEGTPLQTYTGTPDFLAPEVLVKAGLIHCQSLTGRDAYTVAVDMWSLGKLIFQALTQGEHFVSLASYVDGKIPFPNHLLQAHDVSSDGIDLLKKLLTAIPEERLSAREASKKAWFASQDESSSPRESSDNQRPQSTLFGEIDFLEKLDRQRSPTIASQTWSEAESPTIASKAWSIVRGAAEAKFPILARQLGPKNEPDVQRYGLGLSTIVEQASPPANDSSVFDLSIDHVMHQESSPTNEPLASSDNGRARGSTVSSVMESTESLSSDEERRSSSTTPSYVTHSATLRSTLDSSVSLDDSEQYLDRPIAADGLTLSPGTTISEASPSQSAPQTSPRTPREY